MEEYSLMRGIIDTRWPVRSTQQLGQAIKRIRKTQHRSQETLAKLAGLRQAGISQLEAGAQGVRLETIFKILASLDLEIILQKRKKGNASPQD